MATWAPYYSSYSTTSNYAYRPPTYSTTSSYAPAYKPPASTQPQYTQDRLYAGLAQQQAAGQQSLESWKAAGNTSLEQSLSAQSTAASKELTAETQKLSTELKAMQSTLAAEKSAAEETRRRQTRLAAIPKPSMFAMLGQRQTSGGGGAARKQTLG